MKLYNYLFNWIFRLATRNSYDKTPEYTALFFQSQLIIFNFLTIIFYVASYFRPTLANFAYLILCVFVFVTGFNYFYFIRLRKNKYYILRRSVVLDILMSVYIITTFIFFFSSLASLASELKNNKESIYSLNGCWVSDRFLQNLIKTKNSNISVDGINLSMINIEEKGKSSIIWGFYEGTDFTYKIADDTLVLKNDANTNIKFLYNPTANKLVDKDGNLYSHINSEKVIEEVLFQGLYKDSSNKMVTFYKNGVVSGMKNIEEYALEFQNSLPDSNYNIIYLKNAEDEDTKFAYKIDTMGNIEIFKLKCTDDSDDGCLIGELFLKLIKQKL